MKATTCPKAFAEGKADSQKHPRDRGAYKLMERLEQWRESEREVVRIARTVTRPSAKYDLSHCTLEDRHIWLREILKITAYELSASIIPAFKALTGDGMAQPQIDQHLPYVERRCQEVLQELERARLTIKGRIKEEYERMRHGESEVGDALAHAREMLEEIIDLGPPEIQRQIYPTVLEVQCEIGS
jgi:hypothetical protein